jgi:hypothetical protein
MPTTMSYYSENENKSPKFLYELVNPQIPTLLETYLVTPFFFCSFFRILASYHLNEFLFYII